jgi:cytochrome c biogenesis protein
MRFAISLLVIIAIAALIGTVLQQNQAYPDYIVEFGEFWFKPFEAMGLFDVYHASWFLGMLAFLVLSTSLCIYRHLPGVLRDVRQYREHAALKSLRAMSHQVESDRPGDAAGSLAAAATWLRSQGYRLKQVDRADGALIAAKRGSMQRIGYLLAHSAIVVICLGGLLDGNVPLKLQVLLGNKDVETRNIPQSQIPARSRLSERNLSFRGNLELPEGQSGDVIFINAGRGYFVQDLPFLVKLKQFHVEHYSTGQPKLFASDIEVTDKATGKVTTGTVQVNHPLVVNGIAIYQSNFGDGGSPLTLTLWDWTAKAPSSQPLKAQSLSSQPLNWQGQPLMLEFGEFRPFNIESMGEAKADDGMGRRMDDAREVKAKKRVKNLGPSIQFKVRDSAGQAREYLNYLAPFEEDGRYYLISGTRSQISAAFGFVRLPLDGEFKLDTFMRLAAVMGDSAAWPEIAKRTAERALAGQAISAPFRPEFEQSVSWVLQRFHEGGMAALENFLDAKVPAEKRQAVAQTYIKLLQGATIEAMNIAQARANLPPIAMDEKQYRFLLDGLVALSSRPEYGNFYLQPVGFTEVKSSGFQMTRSPGQPLVYIGSILLVLGIFFMFYVRENRIWVWAGNEGEQGRLLLAMSSNRRDDQTEREFATHRQAFETWLGLKESQA